MHEGDNKAKAVDSDTVRLKGFLRGFHLCLYESAKPKNKMFFYEALAESFYIAGWGREAI